MYMTLQDLTLDDRGAGKAMIYQRGEQWKSWKRMPSPAAANEKEKWLELTGHSLTQVERRTQVQLEHAYRNPKEVQKVFRFQRGAVGIAPARTTDQQISELVQQVLTSLADDCTSAKQTTLGNSLFVVLFVEEVPDGISPRWEFERGNDRAYGDGRF